MRAFTAIYSRELKSYFYSPLAYALIAGFLALTGYFFFSGVAFFSMASLQAMQNPMMMKLNQTEMLAAPLLSNMSIILMFCTPILTMRLLSEEKKSGTIELLLSYPLTDFCVVVAKFLAAWTVLAVMLVLTWVHVGILVYLGDPHLPTVAVGYLGLLLMGGGFLAMGLLASAASENQTVAAFLAFVGLLLMWILGWSSQIVGKAAGKVLQAISLSSRYQNFPKGIIDTADLVYFGLFIAFFLFLSIRTLEAKRWRG